MACDTQRKENQSMQERIAEVRSAVDVLDKALQRRRVKVVVGPQGAITFTGWEQENRAGVTDACAYRRIMATGSTLAKLEIQRAEQMAGRTVSRDALVQGLHSHDGGRSWNGKG